MTENLPTSFSFKENVLVPCVVSTFFGLAAAVVALACLLKVGENFFWLIPGVAAAALTVTLLLFAFNSLRFRQVVTISPQTITSRSLAYGSIEIPWRDVTKISREDMKGENMRRSMPGLEMMLAMYINLPLVSGGEQKAIILIEAEGANERRIALRSHLLYPHRLEQLRLAAERYAPDSSQGMKMLRLNVNN